MNKFSSFFLLLWVACIVACGENILNVNATKLSLDLRLNGTPVVKVLSRADKHWLMTETIIAEPDRAKEPEQERALKLVESQKLSNVNHAVSKDEYLTDIALGPEVGQLWVAITSAKNSNVFILRLLNDREILWEISVTEPDEKQASEGGNHYPPGIKDYIRIVSEETQLFIVGKNMFGSPFFCSY